MLLLKDRKMTDSRAVAVMLSYTVGSLKDSLFVFGSF